MQQTFHKPDEAEGRHGLRMSSSLQKDYEYADYVMAECDERSGLIQSATRSTSWFVHNLFFYTQKRWMMRVGWIIEFVANILILVAAGTEVRSNCILEFGVEVMCYSCYGLPFLIWLVSFSFLWLLNLYMHVLLISRGFNFPAKNPGKVLDESRRKGIPGIAVIVFLFLVFLLFAMIIGGIVLLVKSSSCPTVPTMHGVRTLQRSDALLTAMILTMIVSSIALPIVRFSEIFKKEPKEGPGPLPTQTL